MGSACGTYGEDTYRVLVRRPEGTRPLGKPRHRWKDNIKRIFMNWDGRAWSALDWLRIGTSSGLL
jgi:hypothetical protein